MKEEGMTREVITRDIVGYEGLYSIDIFGNVINLKNNREVKQQKNQFGYIHQKKIIFMQAIQG